MKTRVYTVHSEAMTQSRTRAHLKDARAIANSVCATTGSEVRISRTIVEGPDTDVVVALMRLAHGEDVDSDQYSNMIRSEALEVHHATEQIPIAVEGPIPWRVEVERLDGADDDDA